MKAVFLAAGIGERIQGKHDCPKGFLKFGNKPIIVEAIDTLKANGVNDILLVIGYKAHFYEVLSNKIEGISTVFNPDYASSGSLYSLICTQKEIDEDFLLLESDLIFEPRAIEELLEVPHRNVTLLSGRTDTGDEVFVESYDNKMVNMSLEKTKLNSVTGELVGISKFSVEFFETIINMTKPLLDKDKYLGYEEDGMVLAAQKMPLFCHLIEDLIWTEIDDASQYTIAKNRIYPLIHKKKFALSTS